MTKPDQVNIIDSVAALQAINGETPAKNLVKKITKLETHSRNFIAASPFLILATSGPDGCDASPRGDAPGFVKCLDDTTLLLPERPGNRIADSMRNIINNPEVGLLFMVPGMNDTLRVNGRAYITDHPEYLSQLAARNKTPKLAIMMDVAEIYFHCPKAYIRSSLWEPKTFMDRAKMPPLGRMILEQINGEPPTEELAGLVDKQLEEDAIQNLY